MTFNPKAAKRNKTTSRILNSTTCITNDVTGIQTTIDEATSPAKPPIKPACAAFRIRNSFANVATFISVTISQRVQKIH